MRQSRRKLCAPLAAAVEFAVSRLHRAHLARLKIAGAFRSASVEQLEARQLLSAALSGAAAKTPIAHRSVLTAQLRHHVRRVGPPCVADGQAIASTSDSATLSSSAPPSSAVPTSEPMLSMQPLDDTFPSWLSSDSAATWDASSGTLTVTGAATIIADPGSDEPNIVASGSDAQLSIAPAASPIDVHVGGITLSDGATISMASVGPDRTNSDHNTLVLGTLGSANDPTFSVDSQSQIDLQDNDLIVHTGSSDSSGAGEYSTVEGLAALGRNPASGAPGQPDGQWNGNGLSSSAAAAADASAGYETIGLGVVVNSTLAEPRSAWQVGTANETLGANDIIVKYDYLGDYNLEGAVNADDAGILQIEYDNGTSNTHTWATGCSLDNGRCDANEAAVFQLQYGLGTGATVGAPSGLTATGTSTSEIDLNWTNNSTTATGIEIDRWTAGRIYTPIATGLSTGSVSYNDTGLPDDAHYWYEVRATGPGGAFANAVPSDAWTIPAAPSGLTASVPNSFEVDLNWTNNSSGSPTFTIERSTDGINFTAIDTTAAGATSYQDLTVTDNVTYTYQVVATNGAGANSAPSNAVTVSTPQAVLDALTATGVSATEIDLAWTDNSGGTAAAQVWRSLDDSTWTLAATVAAGTTSYPDTGLTPDTIYYYYLSTTGPSSTASSNQTAGVTLPTAPTGLTATPGTDNGDVQLSWSDSANDNDGYEILGSSDGSSFTVIADVDAGTASYDDLSAADGVTDYYQVEAFGLGGDSAPTAVASATPIATIQASDDTPADGVNYQVLHGQTLTINASDLLSNDVDPNNNPNLTIQSFTQPSGGTLTDNGDGTFTYTANNSYTGVDSFTYTPTDQYNAPSNAATVQIEVTDRMPEASSGQIPVVQAVDSNQNPLPYPAAVTGTMYAFDPNGDSDTLTYSASIVSGPGSFSYDSSTGDYTYTPSQSDQGAAVIVFTANDVALTSNKASLIFPGWKIDTTDPDDPDNDGDENAVIPAANLPNASNQYFPVDQGGSLQVYASSGLLSVAQDTDPSPDSDTPSVGALIESPQHGNVSINNQDGSFSYTPDPSFAGRDWFTWQVDDGGKQGEYATVFIDVQPVTVTISVGSLRQGDPTAQIPNDQFPPDANGDPQYATINLGVPWWNLPTGSTVTLSVNSDVQSDLDVYDGVPGEGGNLLLGSDAGTDTYTWTISDTQSVPSQVYAVGLAGTDYDQITFTLSVGVGTTEYGDSGDNSPDAGPPPTQPTTRSATTQGSEAGKKDFLEALDGTNDNEGSGTDIRKFYLKYPVGLRDYQEGVANPKKDPNWFVRKAFLALGEGEAKKFEGQAKNAINAFYSANKQNQIDVLDVVGYSRGAMEAVKLLNDLLTNGLPNVGSIDLTRDGHVAKQGAWEPVVRFVGLISPVIGPNQMTDWPTSIPPGVAYLFQALSATTPLPQNTITAEGAKGGNPHTFELGHEKIGYDEDVLTVMTEKARDAGVIFT